MLKMNYIVNAGIFKSSLTNHEFALASPVDTLWSSHVAPP